MSQPEIEQLVQALQRRGLETPLRMLLSASEPLDLLACQLALLLEPLAPVASWRSYLHVLGDQAGWRALRQALEQLPH